MSLLITQIGDDVFEARDAQTGNLWHELNFKYLSEGIVIGRHYGVQTSSILKDILMNHVLIQLRKRPPKCAIVDLTECEIVTSGDAQWMAEDYFPELRTIGLTHQAVVLNASLTTTVSVRHLEALVLDNFTLKYFFDFGAAMAWVRGVAS